MKYTASDIRQLGTILGIWAHPDDEAWTMAGVLAAARQNGQRVVIVTATRGEAGKTADQTRWPQAELRQIRTKELEASLASLGVYEHHWLDYPDGSLPEVNVNQAVERLAEIIREVDPDSIFSFEPAGITGHEDHKTVCSWTKAAAQFAGSPAKLYGAVESTEKYQTVLQKCPTILKDIYFNTPQPHTVPLAETAICFELTPQLMAMKRTSLRQQDSQTAQLFESRDGQTFMNEQIACECFIDLLA